MSTHISTFTIPDSLRGPRNIAQRASIGELIATDQGYGIVMQTYPDGSIRANVSGTQMILDSSQWEQLP